MRKCRILLSIFMILIPWMGANAAIGTVSKNDPISLLRYIADNMVHGLKANKATLKDKPQIVYTLAYKYVVPYTDLTAMSKQVIPPAVWNKATAAERAQFQKQFTTTVIRTYASALTSYEDQVVRFSPIRGGYNGLKTVEVSGEIDSAQSQPIHVTYRLMRSSQAWHLYDMSVEGVSLLESFRAQFSDILEQGDMHTLLNRMISHNSGHH